MSNKLSFQLLGGLTISQAGDPVSGFRSRKEQALLCYLVVTGKPHTRPFLAGLFWGDRPDHRALGNLRRALTHLRAVAGDHLLITQQTVAFNRESDYWLDVEEFENLVNWETGTSSGRTDWSPDQSTNLTVLREAVELYQGDFLEGFYVRGAPAFEEWMIVKRERLWGLAMEALRMLADSHQARGEYSAAIAYTRRLLALEPWFEEAHRTLMHLLVLNGQRELALTQYEECRRSLAEELGLDPLEETTALYECIRTASPARLYNLPSQPTPFVGRKEELAAMVQRLVDPTCRLLTIVGPGGVGKTRLAIQAATEASVFFLHGVCFVPLASVGSTDLLISAIGQALGFLFRARQDPKTQLFNYLREKEILLVLDNFEHLLPSAQRSEEESIGLLVDLLQHIPTVKILITSRERLDLRWEWLFEIAGLQVPKSETDAGIEDYSAVQLFRQAARRVHWQFTLSKEESSVVRICRLVAGMPLGIELAAAWVGMHSCAEIAQAVGRNLELLTTSLRDVPARHRSMRAAFDHSWRLLSEEEQRVFCKLSVFRGGFHETAAIRVAGASRYLLSTLVNKSLLRQHSSGRYELHELLRQYAAEHLQAAGEETDLHERHVNYFLALAEQAGPELERADQEIWLERLAADHDNLRAALEWSTSSKEVETGLRLAGAMWRFWEVRGHLVEGYRWLEKMLARASDGQVSVSARTKALCGAGRLAQCLGEYEQAAVLLEESLALLRELEDEKGIAYTLNNLGLVAWHQGDYSKAIATHEESLALKRRMGDRRGIASSLGNLALVIWYQGDYGRARTLYSESLALFRQLKDKQNIALALKNLGALAREQGDYEEATAFLEESLVLFRELGSRRNIAYSIGLLGYVAKYQKDYERAKRLWEQSLTVLRELGDKRVVATLLADLGSVASAQGEYGQAETLYHKGLTLMQEVGGKRDIAGCLKGLAEVACGRKQADRAACLFGIAEALRETVGAPLPPADRADYEHTVATLRAKLDKDTFEQAWNQGRAMPLEQAIEYALGKDLATMP